MIHTLLYLIRAQANDKQEILNIGSLHREVNGFIIRNYIWSEADGRVIGKEYLCHVSSDLWKLPLPVLHFELNLPCRLEENILPILGGYQAWNSMKITDADTY